MVSADELELVLPGLFVLFLWLWSNLGDPEAVVDSDPTDPHGTGDPDLGLLLPPPSDPIEEWVGLEDIVPIEEELAMEDRELDVALPLLAVVGKNLRLIIGALWSPEEWEGS